MSDKKNTEIAVSGGFAALAGNDMLAEAIQSITVNGQEMYLEETGTTASGTALINNVDTGTFVFVATDTRGFTTTVTQELTLIPYEVVTLAYTWARPSSTGSTVNLTLNGRWFNGSFGLKTNTLTVEVKVKRSDSSTWGTTTAVNTTKSGNTWKQLFPSDSSQWDGEVGAATWAAMLSKLW